ncbi:hypothetical protein G7Y89_g11356 [Cudoniella acicularis]|uniref:Uncharacterized protein n=1 Tax=Cudoniella acicularis TaxID=354080 RepID=A0A8H4VYC8_9HELO|nr:hypothetical protein G7Y89_g11356 [Cudoniella acicularis]
MSQQQKNSHPGELAGPKRAKAQDEPKSSKRPKTSRGGKSKKVRTEEENEDENELQEERLPDSPANQVPLVPKGLHKPVPFRDNKPAEDFLLPYLAMVFSPVHTSSEVRTYGIRALLISYRAAIKALDIDCNINPDTLTFTYFNTLIKGNRFRELGTAAIDVLMPMDQRPKRGEINDVNGKPTRPEWDDLRGRMIRDATHTTHVGMEGLKRLLQVVNKTYGTEFDLGVITRGHRGIYDRIKETRGENYILQTNGAIHNGQETGLNRPLLWVYHGNEESRNGQDWAQPNWAKSNHWEGFTGPDKKENLNRKAKREAVRSWELEKILDDVAKRTKGVWRVTENYEEGDKDGWSLGVGCGHFVRKVARPDNYTDRMDVCAWEHLGGKANNNDDNQENDNEDEEAAIREALKRTRGDITRVINELVENWVSIFIKLMIRETKSQPLESIKADLFFLVLHLLLFLHHLLFTSPIITPGLLPSAQQSLKVNQPSNAIMQLTHLTTSFALISAVLGLTSRGSQYSGLDIPDGPRSMDNYKIDVMTLNGTIHGVPWTGQGTIEQIYAEFTKAHPDVVAAANAPKSAAGKRNPESKSIVQRDEKTGLFCVPIPGWDWTGADIQRIGQGIQYLDNVDAYCIANGHSCSRISCSYNSDIWLCNDNDGPIYNGCSYMATFAQDIINSCSVDLAPVTWTTIAGGQEFDTNDFNIIVRSDSC